MFYSQDIFIAYSDLVLEKAATLGTHKDAGLTVAELRDQPGLGAACLITLADFLKIEEGTVILRFVLDANFQVQYSIPPALRKGKNDAGSDDLLLNIGDFNIPIKSLTKSIMEFSKANGYGLGTFKTIHINPGTPQAKEIGGYKIDLTPKGQVDGNGDPISVEDIIFEFAVAPNRKEQEAQQKIVALMNPSLYKFTEIYNNLVSSEYVGKIGSGQYTTKLKELPVGIYELTDIDRVDKVITKKDGQSSPIKGWSFDALNITTKESFYVECSDGCFIDKEISGTGLAKVLKKSDPSFMTQIREALKSEAEGKTDEQVLAKVKDTPKILRQAGVGQGGKVLMFLKEQKVIPQGISPQGQIMTNCEAAMKIWAKPLEALLASEAQKQLSAAPAAEATINVAPIKELQPA